MERNREARRGSMAAATNGLSRRRHRPNSLRDSPDEEGQVEFSESTRLRERVKKDRDRDRDRSSRSKRRRGERLMHSSDKGDDSSQESNDDEDYDEADGNHHHHSNGGGGSARLLPQNPSSAAAAAASFPNHHHPSSGANNHLQHRKTFPPSSTNILRASPVWKSGDEMIGISVPRKARSAHTKRVHDWTSSTSGGAANNGGVGGDPNHHQASASPVTPSAAPPLSPSSSNASGRKKIKSKQRPPKTSLKSTSSNREELEIEIAEVLYGLRTQSQAPKKEIAANDSRETAAVSNSPSPAILPMNSNSSTPPFSAIAPKRKKPRQVSENQSITSTSSEKTMAVKAEASSPNSEKIPFENGVSSHALNSSVNSQSMTMPLDPVPESMVDSGADQEAERKEEAFSQKKDSAAVAVESEDSAAMAHATTSKPSAPCEVENHREKIQIDLMAPPPQLRSSPDGEGEVEAEEKKAAGDLVETESKQRIDLQLDFEKPERDNESQQPLEKTSKEQQNLEKASQSSCLPLPMSMASWSGGLPPLGYMAPLQGVLTMDGSTIPSMPQQPMFSQPRPKRCASHCYIARNIHLLQQFMKMNPFWPSAASSAPLFGSKASNVATELNVGRGASSKERGSQAPSVPDPVQRKQQQQPILLQQPLPPLVFCPPFNGAAKSPAATGAPLGSSDVGNGNGSATTGGTHAAVGFSYPNVPPNESPYLAILQNNGYFQIPASLSYRGAHPPLFNGSFYTPPQMIHPPQQPTNSQSKQNTSMSSGSSSSHKHHLQNQKQQPQSHAINGNGNLHNFPTSKSHQNIIPPPQGEDSPSTAESRGPHPPMNLYNQNYVMQIHHNFGAMGSTSSCGNQSEKKQQQAQQHHPLMPQHFSMPFAPGIDKHAMFQSLPEATRQNLHIVAQQKKSYTEESRGGDPTTAADERKVFSDVSVSKMAATNVIDSSRSMNLGSAPAWAARAVMPNSAGSAVLNAQLHAQFQHQLQKQQLGSKAPSTSNGIVHSEHLTSSAPLGAKFSNTISAFPQNLVHIGSPSQSPQWKGSARASPSQAVSSLKNHTQQQVRIQQQNHTQISFGANQKSTSQGQSQSSTMMAGSPTTSSISKGASGSPRTATSASITNKADQAAQQGQGSIQIPNQKSSPACGRGVPSILGNQHIPSTSSCGSKSQMLQQQQHLPKGAHQSQSQLFFSGSYAQAQCTSTSSASATSGYFVHRRRPEQQQPPGSTGMLTLCPIGLGGGNPSNSAKSIAVAAAAASSNMKAGSLPSQGILHTTQFSSKSSGNQHHILPAGFSYVQHASAAVHVKPKEQKQPAGNDNFNACWQPEKR